MPRKKSKAVPESNDGPIHQQEEFGSGHSTLADVYKIFKERFDQSDRYWYSMRSHSNQLEKKLDEMVDMTRGTNQRLASLEHDARQPRLVMEADGQADTKTRERTEGAATAVQAMRGDSCSANRVDPDSICSISFGGNSTGSPALPCSEDDASVGKGTAAPKLCLLPLEMRTTAAAGGLLLAGETSTATSTTFDHSTLWFCQTVETMLRIPTPSASYDSSFWRNNLLAAPSCRRVIETKSGQNRMLDSGGSEGRLRACLFLGTWRVLLYGEVFFLQRLVTICSVF